MSTNEPLPDSPDKDPRSGVQVSHEDDRPTTQPARPSPLAQPVPQADEADLQGEPTTRPRPPEVIGPLFNSAPIDPELADLLYVGWTVIANAPGWGDETEWRQAAEAWRDRWYAVLGRRGLGDG